MPVYSPGLHGLDHELNDVALAPVGAVPAWLEGTLVRNGPALFDISGQTFNHWFDGLAALHKFVFRHGTLSYSCRFLRSNAFNRAMARRAISSVEFGTRRKMTAVERVKGAFLPELTDNANVNVMHMDNRWMAMTETPHIIEFSQDDLHTIGPVKFADQLKFHVTTAHPQFDYKRGALHNIAVSFGPRSHYLLFEQRPGSNLRKLVGRVQTGAPGYMHSFAVTEKYAIFCEFPIRLSLPQLLYGEDPYVQCYHWRSQSASNFIVMSKENGEVVRRFEADACFAFHQINACEKGNQLLVDMVVYDDAAIIGALTLKNMRADGPVPVGRPRRFCLNLDDGKVSAADLAYSGFEFPQVNYRAVNGRRYRYCYGAGTGTGRAADNFLDDLRKIDVEKGTVTAWKDDGCYPGEPVFVPRPEGVEEDDGVLLSVVLNGPKKESFLLVLDAVSMKEMARFTLPQVAPFTFHGIFARGEND